LKKGRIAFFVTGNVHKFHEARAVLKEYGISTAMLDLETNEIQADEIDAIARASALEAATKSAMPVFVEDAGLFIIALNGFPGPYSSYVYRTLGNKGILKLMKNTDQRDACFHSVVAFCDPAESYSLKCFSGKVKGRVTFEERGKRGFGFDPVFKPEAELGRTFAEMTQQEKNKYSHRALALARFGEWYLRRHAQSRLENEKEKKK
jgi:XTP/dITP diphosphohydrolase